MVRILSILAAAAVLLAGATAIADEPKGSVYTPQDGKSFAIAENDIVRLHGPSPGSTGFRTTVELTAGKAKVTERAQYVVANGQVTNRIGGGALEFDVKPEPGFKGTIKVTLTKRPPGAAKPEVTEYEFEVK